MAAQQSTPTPTGNPKRPRRRSPMGFILNLLFHHAYNFLITVVLAGIISGIVSIIIAYTPDHYGEGIANTFDGLIAFVQDAPIVAGAAIALAIIIAWGGSRYERAREAAERKQQTEQTQTIASDAGAQAGATAGAEAGAQAARQEIEKRGVTPPTVRAPSGLPRPVELVGRDAELASLMSRLRDGNAIGIFALEGMGGIGKTALAAEAVARLSGDASAFPGGAVWISCEGLEGATGLNEVWSRVALAFGLDAIAKEDKPETRRLLLANALGGVRRTLLALDNVEPQLSGTIADQAGSAPFSGGEALLNTLAIPGHVALLLTARQPIAPGRLEPLRVELLTPGDAATLFGDTLARTNRRETPRPDDADRTLIPTLVAQLGRLPLSIDLTATYAGRRGATLDSVLAELEHDGLAAGALQDRDRPQRSLEARLARSYAALTATQQRLFAGLALQAEPSFPRAAALAQALAARGHAATNGDAPDRAEERAADDDVQTLIDYSLVELLADDRLRLHPSLRQYAGERLRALGPAVEEPLGDALVAYWLAYARAYPGYEGMDALVAEANGLMGAIRWAHAHGRHATVFALARVLGRPWDIRGRRGEEREIDQYMIDAAKAGGNLEEQGLAEYSAAITLGRMGYIDDARAGYARALALAEQLGDPAAIRDEVHELAFLDARTGHLPEARAGYARALALAEQLGDPAAIRDEVHGLAARDFAEGNHKAAAAGFERALEMARQLGDPNAIGYELISLAETIRYDGQTERAREMLTEALGLFEQLGAPYEIGKTHEFLARLDEQEGKTQDAIAHYRVALRLFEQIESPDAEDMRQALRALGAEA